MTRVIEYPIGGEDPLKVAGSDTTYNHKEHGTGGTREDCKICLWDRIVYLERELKEATDANVVNFRTMRRITEERDRVYAQVREAPPEPNLPPAPTPEPRRPPRAVWDVVLDGTLPAPFRISGSLSDVTAVFLAIQNFPEPFGEEELHVDASVRPGGRDNGEHKTGSSDAESGSASSPSPSAAADPVPAADPTQLTVDILNVLVEGERLREENLRKWMEARGMRTDRGKEKKP